MSNSATTSAPNWRPLALSIVLAGSLLGILIRLIPYEIRLHNLAPFGALCLFAGARIRTWWAWAIPIAALTLSDIYFIQLKYWQPEAACYLCYAVIIALGWFLLRNSESPWRIAGTAFLGSILFFVISNFAAWLDPILGYPRTMAGLVDCYVKAIPFYRGTFVGDMFFSGLFFGSYAWLTRTYFPAERVLSTQGMS